MSDGLVASGTISAFSWEERTSGPASAIWALWTDPSTWSRWDPEVETASVDGELRLGATGILKGRGAPPSRFAVTAFEEGIAYELTTALPLGGRLVMRRWLERDGEGTRYHHAVRFIGVGGWLIARVLGGRYRRALPRVLAHIKVLAEGGLR